MKDEDERGTHRLSPTPMMLLLIQHRAVVDANLCLVCRKHGCIFASDMAYGVYQLSGLLRENVVPRYKKARNLTGYSSRSSQQMSAGVSSGPLFYLFLCPSFLSFVVAHFFSARFLNPAYKRFRWLAPPPVLLQLHRMCCT